MNLKKSVVLLLVLMMSIGAVPAYAVNIADEEVVYEVHRDSDGNMNVVVDKHPELVFTEPLPNNQIRIVIDNVELPERGMAIDGRTLVPLRAIAEALDVKVEWNASKRTIHMEKVIYTAMYTGAIAGAMNTQLNMTIGQNYYFEDGAARNLEVPAQIINGKTMVPVRAVTKCFDAQIAWEETSRTVKIVSSSRGTIAGAISEAQYGGVTLEPFVPSEKPSNMTEEEYAKSLGETLCWLNWTPETYIKLINEKSVNLSYKLPEGKGLMLPKIDVFVNYDERMKQSVLGSQSVLMLLMDTDTGLIEGTTVGYLNDENTTKVDRGIYRFYSLSNIYYSKEGMTLEEALEIMDEVQVPLNESGKNQVIKGQMVYMSSYDADKKLVQFVATKGKTS